MEGDVFTQYKVKTVEAKRSFLEKAHSMYRQFLQQYGIAPNVFFLTRSDFEEATHVQTFMKPSQAADTFLGLKLVLTELDRSYVALIPKEMN